MSSRFKGLGSISSDVVPPPPIPPTIPASPAAPVAKGESGCDPRFLVPSVERFMVHFRAYHSRMDKFHASLPNVSLSDMPFFRAAECLGLVKQWGAVKALESRLELLMVRRASDADFGKAVAALESSFCNFLTAMDKALPGSQGSLL